MALIGDKDKDYLHIKLSSYSMKNGIFRLLLFIYLSVRF